VVEYSIIDAKIDSSNLATAQRCKGGKTFATNGRTVVEHSFTKAKIENPATVSEENNECTSFS
jgi:hypothetical protein